MADLKVERTALLDGEVSSDSDSLFDDAPSQNSTNVSKLNEFVEKAEESWEDQENEDKDARAKAETEITGCAFFRHHRWTKAEVITNVALFADQLGWGMGIGLQGPMFLDIMTQSHTTVSQMSLGYTAVTLGGAIFSVLGGCILDAVDFRIFLLFAMLYHGAMLSIYAWGSTSFVGLLAVSALLGTSMGFVGCGNNVATMYLWGYGGNILMQAYHATFGLGTIIAPWLASPFIAHTEESNVNPTSTTEYSNYTTTAITPVNTSTTVTVNNSIHLTGSGEQTTRVQYAYLLITIWFTLVSCLYLAAYLAHRSDTRRIHQNMDGGRKSRQSAHAKRTFEPTWFRVPMILLIAACFGSYVGLESQYAAFLTAFMVKGLGRPKAEGLALTATYRTAFTLSRAVNVAIALCLSPVTMIILDLMLTTLAYVFLSFTAQVSSWSLWVGSCMVGLGMGSFYGCLMGLTEKQLKVTGKLASVISFGDTIGVSIMTFTIGHLFDSVGPMTFMYVCLADSILLIILFSSSIALFRYYRNRMNYQKAVSINLREHN